MKYILSILLFICACMKMQAQINLVQNPSFEQYSFCPDPAVFSYPCNGWNPLDSTFTAADTFLGGTPCYCNVCATYPAYSIPWNIGFYHYPRTGNGLMMIEAFDAASDTDFIDSTGDSRWYAQGHLVHILTRGHNYNVTFYTLLAGHSTYAINHISAYLDDGTIDTTHSPGSTQVQYTPQVDDTSIINDSVNWTKVGGTFTANGTERLITIGNFHDRFHTSSIVLRDTFMAYLGGYFGYYLIDDVSIIDCSNVPYAVRDTMIHPGDSVFLGVNELLIPYTWYIRGDTIPFDTGAGVWVHPTVTTTYVVRNNICGTREANNLDTVVVRVWPDTVTAVSYQLSAVSVRVYPNPATSLLTVEGGKGCSVVIYNVVGNEVYRGKLSNVKETINIDNLVKGVYFVEITDGVTGYRVVRQVLKE